MKTREEMADRLFKGAGVELGVAAGHFSRWILDNCKEVTQLWSIDRWSDHHGLAEYKSAAERLSVGGIRSVVLRMTFKEALPLFHSQGLDFVYIDGYAHTGQEGGETLDDWWTKLRPGGVFAGHDYHPRWQPNVDTVDAFTKRHGLILQTSKQDRYPSWWVIKPVVKSPLDIPLQIQSGQTVCLVGNGPGVLQCRGEEIDSHDVVIRFNRFRIAGFEHCTGRKTTIWSTFGHGYLPGDEDQRPKRMIYVYGETGEPAYQPETIHRIPRSFYNQMQARLRSLSAKESPGITSGCVVTAWLLEGLGVPRVSLAGFDHFSKQNSKQHHYYNPRLYGKPPELDGDAERLIFAEWEKAGRVNYL